MTRLVEPGGPSRLPGAAMPFRAAPRVPLEANENDRFIQEAVTKGKDISESLADILRQSSLADNEESRLHEVLSLAEELRDYQSPVEVTIGFVGDTGVGKSSLINSLLEKKKLAKTANSGEFGTSTVTEYRKKRDSDHAVYTIEIERMRDREMDDLLRQSVVDYRRFHLRDHNDESASQTADIEALRQKAKEAWNTISAAFGDQHECTEQFFNNAELLTDEITRTVLGWKDQIRWSRDFSTGVAIKTAESEDGCEDELQGLLEAWMWPFIKVTRIYLDAAVLRTGVVLVDLPGYRDINSARVRITEARLFQCDEVFVVANIGRVITNTGVDELVVRQLGNNFSGLRRSQGVSVICTKSDDVGPDHEILRDVDNTPGPHGFNPQAMAALRRQIEDTDSNATSRLLEAKRTHFFITARNKHVQDKLIDHYSSRNRERRINVYCVSNKLHTDATEIEENISDDRRTSNFDEKILRARQLHESSGIQKLREFVEGIPSRARILETKYFLETRLERLLQKFNLWLNASVADLAANQPAAPEFVQELQTELKRIFDASILNNYTDLNNFKRQLLEQPLNQGVNAWEAAALGAVSRWEGWHAQTILAFWRNEGAHSTARQTWMNWNEEIIRMMVDDMQPREEQINAEADRAFRALVTSTQQGLSSLSLKLEGFDGVEYFIQTFDRRKRNLEYEINTVTTWFFDKFQMVVHDLLKAHGTSYVMQHMRPMYDEIDSGNGVKQRRIAALKLRIQGDRIKPRLFKEIRNSCINDASNMLDDTKRKLQDVLDACSADIESDLELVRSNEAPSSDENDLTNQMFELLEVAQQNRDNALRDFEAGIRSGR